VPLLQRGTRRTYQTFMVAEHLRGLLPSARVDLPPKLLLFSRSGFTPGLIEEADAPDVELVTLERVYRGS
jgi:hypothetical protein